MPDGPGAGADAPGPSTQAWLSAFQLLAEQRGQSHARVAEDVGLGHLISDRACSNPELHLDQQAMLANAIGVPLSVVLALAEEIDQPGGPR